MGETTKPGYTPPKGRPTRTRDGGPARRRIFGATTQWVALVGVLALVIIVIWVVTDGGDFNPFNDGYNTGVVLVNAAVRLLFTG